MLKQKRKVKAARYIWEGFGARWTICNVTLPMCKGVASGEDVTAGGSGSQRGRRGRREEGEKGFWVECVCPPSFPSPWGVSGHFWAVPFYWSYCQEHPLIDGAPKPNDAIWDIWVQRHQSLLVGIRTFTGTGSRVALLHRRSKQGFSFSCIS